MADQQSVALIRRVLIVQAQFAPPVTGKGYPFEAKIGLPRWSAYAWDRWQAALVPDRWSAEVIPTA